MSDCAVRVFETRPDPIPWLGSVGFSPLPPRKFHLRQVLVFSSKWLWTKLPDRLPGCVFEPRQDQVALSGVGCLVFGVFFFGAWS